MGPTAPAVGLGAGAEGASVPPAMRARTGSPAAVGPGPFDGGAVGPGWSHAAISAMASTRATARSGLVIFTPRSRGCLVVARSRW